MGARLGLGIAITLASALAAAVPALADPADLDPTWGGGGVVAFPAGDRYDAQGAPLLQSGGKVLATGLLRNASDRVFMDRLTSTGAVDTTFGSDGEVHTNSVAPYRNAPTALLPDGRPLVVAGSSKDGRIALERFTPDGAPDTTFGSSGSGRLTADLGGTFVNPTGVVALGASSALVTALSDASGTPTMTLLKFTTTGLDRSFGSKGVARAAFAKPSGAYALTVLSNGAILVAGAVGDTSTAAADTALARFTPGGALDATFGSGGKASYDLSGAGGADWATGVVADATGGFAVAGPAGAAGVVARFTSTGAQDTTFASGGAQRGGFAPAGTTFVPAGIALDGAGRMVVAGTATTGSGLSAASRWLVARLTRDSGDARDASFATGGAVQLDACANHGGFGPSGVAIQGNGRIDVLGSCGELGQVAVVRLLGRAAFLGGATFSVAAPSEAAGHERVPLANVDPTTVLGAVDRYASAPMGSGPLGSGPMGSGPLGSGPLGSGPLGSGPLGSGPLGSGPLGSGPLGSGPLGSGPLGSGPLDQQILLSDLPLLNAQTWTELLAPYYPEGVPPLQTLTLADAYRVAPAVVDRLTYADIDLSRTPLATASLAAVLLTRPLEDVAPPNGGWCDWLSRTQTALTCANGADPATTTLLALEFAGDDLSSYYARPLSLLRSAGTDLGSGAGRALLAYVDLRQVDVAATPLGAVPASQVAQLLACNPDCSGTLAERQAADVTGWTHASIGDLVALLPLPSLPDLSLGQLLAGLLNPAEIPYERASGAALLKAAELRGDHYQTYTTGFSVDCDQADGLAVVPHLPDDARFVPHSATVAVDGGAPSALGEPSDGAYDVTAACDGRAGATPHVTVAFQAEPGSTLGPKDASVTVRSAFGSVGAATKTTVDDSLDPGNAPTDTRPLTTGKLVHGWIADSGDLDYYSFTAPAENTRVSITLTHVPAGADYDLHVFGPVSDVVTAPLHSGPLGSGPMGSGPMGSGAVPDSTNDQIDPSIAEPDRVQDLPLGSGPLGSGPLGSGSINRGSSDEAVTFRVRRADAGQTITVLVDGYNGSSDPHPYVLRRVDVQPPPAPPCPARGTPSGAKGAWPSSIPSSTQALYLVDRSRLAGLNSSDQADAVMSRLAAAAAQTGGVVVPVESDPDTDTSSAYAAWDADPCDEAKANAVVAQINRVVDDVKRAGDGLRQLRSIVLVGPDAAIPQARLRDDAVLSNESEYANDAMFGGKDDAVSGALRDGYLLSDDPYGDFDVSKTMFVPDVALGRLVETAPEISAQLQRFLDTGGVIHPSDAVVMGYDFFSDGAQDEAASLGTSARLDGWDATAALGAVNRAGSGYTAVNGHYDSYRALPSAAFSGSGSPDLLYARDAEPNPGSVLFTMGCHAGLSISASVADPSDEDRLRLGDWAQRMAQQDALWTGSTGFSYGDTEAVAYTERIMAGMAARLGARDVTVGQALMYAKQRYVATAGVLDVYSVKASEEATFYGLPMYRIGDAGGVGASAMPPAAPSGSGTLTSDPESFAFDAAHGLAPTPHETDRGTYYTAGDQRPLVVQGHPVQPVATRELPASDDGQAHGYLIEGLTTQELAPGDPVIARPTVDLAAHEPEPQVTAPLFPATLATITNEATPGGRRDRLTVAAGQYRGDHQRLFGSLSGRVLRSTGADFTPLAIQRVDGEVTGGTFSVRVEVNAGDAQGGNVLYRTSDDTGSTVTWHRADLAVVGDGLLATGGSLGGAARIDEAIVQVYDDGGNVSVSDYKVTGYAFSPLKAPQAGDPRVVLDPEVPSSGYLQVNPGVKLDPGDHADASFQVSVDGGAWKSYDAGSTLQVPEPADGEHLVAFRGSDGSSAVRQIAIDRAGPTVTAEPDRAPDGTGGWYSGPVTVTFHCADAVSGVASCPGPQTVSGEGADQAVTGTATDKAGNTGSGGITVSIDKTAPAISGKLSPASPDHGAWYWSAPTLSWTCADALSGVASCPADRTVPEGASQTLTGTATDRAGNTAQGSVGPVNVDLKDGTAAITTPNGAVLTASGLPCLGGGTDCHSVNGTASDTATGSGIARVDVTYTPGIGTAVTRQAALSCDAQNRCTWSAGLPPTGIGYRVTVQVTERSGRTFAAGPSSITITVS